VRASMRQPVLVDGRNLYDPQALAALGFTYRGIGLPTPATLHHAPDSLAVELAGQLAVAD
jgi:hypothetical protein